MCLLINEKDYKVVSEYFAFFYVILISFGWLCKVSEGQTQKVALKYFTVILLLASWIKYQQASWEGHKKYE